MFGRNAAMFLKRAMKHCGSISSRPALSGALGPGFGKWRTTCVWTVHCVNAAGEVVVAATVNIRCRFVPGEA